MKHLTITGTLFVWLGLVGFAGAQTPFTLDGLGQNVDNGTARDVGRGGWGMADSDSLNPGSLNQAAVADLRFMQLLFSGSGERTLDSRSGEVGAGDVSIEREQGQDRITWRTQLPHVRLAVPLRSGKLAFHVGFKAKRTFEYESYELIDVERFGEEYVMYQAYIRSGNILEIPLGLAWRPLSHVALGGSLNLVRGPVEDRVVQVFDGGPLANDYTHRLELDGTSFTASILVNDLGPFSLGASITSGYDLQAERTVSLAAVAGSAVTDDEVSMPAEYRGGFMVDLGRNWRFGADGAYTAYGDIGTQTVWPGDLCDEWTLSAGFERRLARKKHSHGYVMPLRFGLQKRRWGYEVNGSPVDETVVSVGTGVPFRNWRGTIDLSLSYAWIGNEADHGVESQSLRLGVSISGLERLVF